MKTPSVIVAPLLAGALGFVPLAAPATQEGANGESGAAAASPALVVQVDHVVPEYRGGDKFRSPPTIDSALAEDLARRLQLPLHAVPATVPVAPAATAAAPTGVATMATAEIAQGAEGAVTPATPGALRLTSLRDFADVPQDLSVVPIDYRAVPMAIMRSDTAIKRWDQLHGRPVCVAAGGNHVGTLAGRYGAVEQVHPSTTDALVALRVGDCDAMVHDSTMLEELIRYPEWRKFSARLRGNQRSTLAFLVPAQDQSRVQALRRVAFEWGARGYPEQLVKKAVRDIAFEVYLEQDVPDCH